jgi:hypothetical protein
MSVSQIGSENMEMFFIVKSLALHSGAFLQIGVLGPASK